VSVAEALSRISAIQAQLAALAPPPPAATDTTDTTGFAQALQDQLGTGSATATTGELAGEATPYDGMIVQAAHDAGIPPALLKAVAKAESGFNPNATSPAGAQGMMQLMPGTAAGLGVTNPFDPMQSLEGGARYLRRQLDAFGGDMQKAVAAYNAGPAAVTRYGGIPPYPETQAYVPRVMGYFAEFSPDPASATTPAPTVDPAALGLPASLRSSGVGSRVVQQGLTFLGTPYVWGGESPSGFDCSGLAQYLYRQQGVSIPRVAADQFRAGTPVASDQMRPGDLVFFARAGYVHHVGIYIGGGKFLQAPHTGDVVKISSLTDPGYASEFCGARRYS
jgi:cell wall-associated NlpC family hydrolase